MAYFFLASSFMQTAAAGHMISLTAGNGRLKTYMCVVMCSKSAARRGRRWRQPGPQTTCWQGRVPRRKPSACQARTSCAFCPLCMLTASPSPHIQTLPNFFEHALARVMADHHARTSLVVQCLTQMGDLQHVWHLVQCPVSP